MAGKIRAKLMMQLREQGTSRRQVAKTRHMSMGLACEAFDLADERRITWEQVEPLPDGEACRLLHPDRHVREGVLEEPDWACVHKEMAKAGADLRLLRDEHGDSCGRRGKVATGYARFCERYGERTAANDLTKRIEHKAGRSCEVDWSGPTVGC